MDANSTGEGGLSDSDFGISTLNYICRNAKCDFIPSLMMVKVYNFAAITSTNAGPDIVHLFFHILRVSHVSDTEKKHFNKGCLPQ